MVFFLTVILIFLSLLIEIIMMLFQLNGRMLIRWFGRNAFNFFLIITTIFYSVAFLFMIILQFQEHPKFHTSSTLTYAGLIFLICGSILSAWAFKLMGYRRSFCINFFEDNVPIVKHSIYKYIKHPMYYGSCVALIGFALFTASIYNIAIAIEIIILLTPYIILENKLLGRTVPGYQE